MPNKNMNTLANTNNGYNALPEEAQTFYDKALLTRMLPELVFAKYGQKRPIPKNAGKTINFRRFTPLEPATTALEEGVTPTGSKLNVDEVEATLEQYGDFVEITDILDLVGIDPVAAETSELLGEQAGKTVDMVVRDIVCAGTNVQYAGGGSSANATISSAEIKKAARTLKKANAPMIDGSYIGIIDPDIAYDIQNDPLWQDISKYSGGTKIMDGEIGKLGGVHGLAVQSYAFGDGGHRARVVATDDD